MLSDIFRAVIAVVVLQVGRGVRVGIDNKVQQWWAELAQKGRINVPAVRILLDPRDGFCQHHALSDVYGMVHLEMVPCITRQTFSNTSAVSE